MLAWELLSQNEYSTVWDDFEEQFDFRPTTYPNQFPSIKEPESSITYHFNYPSAENEDEVTNDINHKSLLSFQNITSPNESIYVLDWQHDCYCLHPHSPFEEWRVPVFPDGDYSIFLAKDFSFGIFAHPWEQTFCIWGNELLTEFQKNKPILFETILRQH